MLPAILFQINGAQTINLIDAFTSLDVLQIISYYLIMLIDMIFNIFNFLINSWPFVFIGAPIIAVLIIIIHLRKNKGKIREKFEQISFEYKKTPFQFIRDRLKENSWVDEKELFKLLVVLLPLSLYILIGSLSAVQYPFEPLAPSSALGWFIEVFVVYLLIPITAIQILHISKASYQGKIFGEKIRESAFYYLLTVGAILSGLSIILFTNLLQTNPAAISTIIYFVANYFMSIIIFTVSLPLYESISSFILVKISDYLKPSDLKLNGKKKGIDEIKIYTLLVGFIVFVVVLILAFILTFTASTLGADVAFFEQFIFNPNSSVGPNLTEQIILEGNIILSFTLSFLGIGLWSLSGVYLSKILQSKVYYSIILSFILSFIIPMLLFQIDIPFIFGSSSYFVVPAPTSIGLPTGGSIITTRVALLRVVYFEAFGFISTPFYIFRSLASAILISLFIYYWDSTFKTKKISIGENNFEAVYSKRWVLPSLTNLLNDGYQYLFNIEEPLGFLSEDKTLVKVYKTLSKQDYTWRELVSKLKIDERELYNHLNYLAKYKSLGVYTLEFQSIYYKANLKGLYIVSQDGRSIFSYNFSEEGATEPVLVAGMLSAISSFVKETTKSRDLLRTIDHGDITLLVEYGRYSFAALLADRETAELRNKLQIYIRRFENRYASILVEWDGDIEPFEKEKDEVIKIFVE
ncbi:MAG: hypothetical protein ACTSYQ_01835 [Candidatus Odinarchaeia archaeon]